MKATLDGGARRFPPVLIGSLLAMWLLLNHSVALGQLLLGLVLAIALAWASTALRPLQPRIKRPQLVIGFAAETDDVLKNAQAKLKKKGADFIVANDVGPSGTSSGGVMGGDRNRVKIVSRTGVEEWPEMGKDEVAARLADLVAGRLRTIAV